jgi:hypothetical protein
MKSKLYRLISKYIDVVHGELTQIRSDHSNTIYFEDIHGNDIFRYESDQSLHCDLELLKTVRLMFNLTLKTEDKPFIEYFKSKYNLPVKTVYMM